MSNLTHGGFLSVSSGSTVLDAQCLDRGIRVLTDTLTDAQESIECLSELLHIGRMLNADRLAVILDNRDTPFPEVEAWVIEQGAIVEWIDNHRMFFYVLPLDHG